MRRHHDPIEVRLGPPHRGVRHGAIHGRTGGDAHREGDAHHGGVDDRGPGQFIWRGRIWRVLEVESRWRESGSWWTGPAVRAARGEVGSPGALVTTGPGAAAIDAAVIDMESQGDSRDDVLCEVEVWRVEAANGREGSRGIYDLAHSLSSGRWHLRAVFD